MQSNKQIPKIDMGPYFENPEKGIYQVAEEIREAYTKVGFAYIYNHGFPQDLIDATFQASKVFHALPLAEKLKIEQNKFFRGFMPLAASTLKISTLGKAIQPNQSEAFIMAHEVEENDPDFLAQTNLAGPNQWPENMPEFKEVISLYYKSALELTKCLVSIFSVSSGLPATGMDHFITKPTTFLRLQYYPEQPDIIPEQQYGLAPHTDYGLLTILAQDENGGLQVKDAKGRWIDVPYIPGTFILNSGDMMKRITNDVYLSTPHRVINRSGKKRYSIPFFLEPSMHAVIDTLAPFVTESMPKKYRLIEYYEHLMQRIRNNYDIGA